MRSLQVDCLREADLRRVFIRTDIVGRPYGHVALLSG